MICITFFCYFVRVERQSTSVRGFRSTRARMSMLFENHLYYKSHLCRKYILLHISVEVQDLHTWPIRGSKFCACTHLKIHLLYMAVLR